MDFKRGGNLQPRITSLSKEKKEVFLMYTRTKKFKRCPFCRNDNDPLMEILQTDIGLGDRNAVPFYVRCTICGTCGPMHNTSEGAEDRWNCREGKQSELEPDWYKITPNPDKRYKGHDCPKCNHIFEDRVKKSHNCPDCNHRWTEMDLTDGKR